MVEGVRSRVLEADGTALSDSLENDCINNYFSRLINLSLLVSSACWLEDRTMSSQTNDSKHTTTGRSTVNEPLAVTDGGQPLSFEPEDCGKKSAQHKFIDRYEYDFQPKFPQPSPAQTNLHSDDVPERETKLTRFWKLQHGKGHTYEGWDTQRVRIEDRDDFRRASALLSQLEVTSFEAVRQRVMSECVNGFNRHYGGFDGACVGFALLYEHETIDKAKDSHLLEKAEEMIDADCEQLAEYVFRKYGGDE